MNYPGTNQLKLSGTAIMMMLQRAMNSGRPECINPIRVTGIKTVAYETDIEFFITTDALPASDTITETKEPK